MTGFTMPCLKNASLKSLLYGVMGWLMSVPIVLSLLASPFMLVTQVMAQTNNAEITQLKAALLDKDLVISAQVKFELPSSIEEAMYKGVSLTFVSELDITRERWYWRDKTVAKATRQIRISYQALTRRWRVLPWSDLASQGGLGVQLPQTYETLPEALAVAQRIHNWRVADHADIGEGDHWITLRYRLDMSQLPKPLQIGLLGQGDWSISATIRQRLQLPDTKGDVKL
jgi:Domain of unknown function (DUF4390)